MRKVSETPGGGHSRDKHVDARDEADLDAEPDRLSWRRIGRMNQRREISTLSGGGGEFVLARILPRCSYIHWFL